VAAPPVGESPASAREANTALVGGIAEELGAFEANTYPCIFGFVLSLFISRTPRMPHLSLALAQVRALSRFYF
jgi:hypothetical protein